MKFDVRADMREVSRYLRGMEKAMPRLTVRAINKAATSARTQAARSVSREIRLKVGEVRGEVDVRKANKVSMTAALVVSKRGRRALNLINWVPKAKRQAGAFRSAKGVRYQITDGSKTLAGAFIAEPYGKPLVFRRKGKARLPIVAKTGPTIKNTFDKPEIKRAIDRRAREIFRKEIERLIKREAAKREATA